MMGDRQNNTTDTKEPSLSRTLIFNFATRIREFYLVYLLVYT